MEEEDEGRSSDAEHLPPLHQDADVASGCSRASSQIGDFRSPALSPLDVSAATATSMNLIQDSAAVFKVPESPATSCKLNFGGAARGRKTSLTGISTGSNGSTSSGVSSMTSEPFDAAAVAATAVIGKAEATSCNTLDMVAQRRVNGSASSFSLEEEEDDVNDVYSR